MRTEIHGSSLQFSGTCDDQAREPEERGLPYNPSTSDHWLDGYLEDNGLQHITLHGFRHTMGTLLHPAGLDTVTVSECLDTLPASRFLGRL